MAGSTTGQRKIGLTLVNTGTTTETVIVTFARAAGTQRQIARAILSAKERLEITGLWLEATDTIYATTTNASTVDYLVTDSDGPFRTASFDANGSLKESGVSGGTLTVAGLVDTGIITGAVGASTAAAGTTTADAGALPAGTATIYPTTAADGTKGVVISTSDKVTGRVLYIGNGVSTAVLKIYPPSGGAINGAAADAAYSTASGKGAVVVCLSGSGNTWFAVG